jgi:hypothetical protein
LSEQEREERRLALRAVKDARQYGVPVEAAADVLGIDMQAVRRWANEALRPASGGRTYPTETDELVRFSPVVLEGESQIAALVGPEEADDAEVAYDVQWRFAHGRATADELRILEGRRIGGKLVTADPETLRRLALANDIDPEDPYREIPIEGSNE